MRLRDLLITPHRFFFGGGGYGCSCKQHKLCLKKAKKKCCCKDKYIALEDILYQLIIIALLGLLIFFQLMGGGGGRRRRRKRSMSPSLPFLHDPQGGAPEGDEDTVRKYFTSMTMSHVVSDALFQICQLARPVFDAGEEVDHEDASTWAHPLDRINRIVSEMEPKWDQRLRVG